ncbi:MAG: lipoyl synthase [Phycisphaeraceae bacterium]|nr:lipoyl synthase [Phycisphaeraceae bacterium]MCW5761969.1 lipoyl synthase [Phycisphaeraceae bacterium]
MSGPDPRIIPTDAALTRTLARHPKPLGGHPIRGAKAVYSLSDMILNNVEAQQLAIKKKPPWLKAKVPGGEAFKATKANIDAHRLHTVCQEASCPNMGECWARGVATIMILGDTCTRACGFCNVKTGKPATTDYDEPRRVADALRGSNLKHIVITSVDRDDLADGGASIWAETILRVRDACPDLSIEVLIGDFKGDEAALQMVIDATPNIIAHNLETVRRCHPSVRPSARYERTLELLRRVKAAGRIAKTGLMVGIGEKREEVFDCLRDIQDKTRATTAGREAACDIITIGQYLQPTLNHLPIDRWVHPDEFAEYERVGIEAGFKVVFSGPLVRSSYLADKQAEGLDLGF